VSSRDWIHWLSDIVDAIQNVVEYTRGMDFESFANDPRTLHAVVYCFISNTGRHIPEEIQNKDPGIPWDKMRGMRNFLVHEYPWISPRIVWETATKDLPPLLKPLRQIIEDFEV